MVLAVRYDDTWGCLGISRRIDLMDKPLQFDSLAALVEEFNVSYRRNFHTLLACYVGLPFSHNRLVDSRVEWRAVKVYIHKSSPEKVKDELATFCSSILM